MQPHTALLGTAIGVAVSASPDGLPAGRVALLFHRKITNRMTTALQEKPQTLPTLFSELPLSDTMHRALNAMKFSTMTPIQAQAIAPALEGADILGQAQTGTGKTAAFAIPVIERINPLSRHTQAIVLCPTRELALQVTETFRQLVAYKHETHQRGIIVTAVYGGQPIMKQAKLLKRNPHIIVGTPGRVMDFMRRGNLNLATVSMAVLDEADEMLNMGFHKDIETILSDVPAAQRQTLLFSATMPPAILKLTRQFQQNVVHVKVAQHDQPVANIEQTYLEMPRKVKRVALKRLVDQHRFRLSLVFCNTKWQVDSLVEDMRQEGFSADGLHGGMSQSQRDRIMKRFRQGETSMLIATDVAARGIDVNNIEAVFNYDVPREPEFYIHRIGRTGRAGKAGRAFMFVEKSDYAQLKRIRLSPTVKLTREDMPM